MVKRLTYDEYKKELERTGYIIKNEQLLKFAFQKNRNQPLDEEELKKYTEQSSAQPRTFKSFSDLSALSPQPKTSETKTEPETRNETKTEKKPTNKKKKKSHPSSPEKSTTKKISIKEIPAPDSPSNSLKTETKNEETNVLSLVTETKNEETNIPSLVEEYVHPLEEWIASDLDKNNAPKREISYETPSDEKLEITITPTPEQEEQGDSGAVISIEQKKDSDSADIEIGPQNDRPLSYEYFYQLLKAAKDNGLETVVFEDVKTKEFGIGLLAAALELELNIENAPEGLDLTPEYTDTLPKKVKNKLRDYNHKNGYTYKGQKISETTNRLKERRKDNKNAQEQPPRRRKNQPRNYNNNSSERE